MSSSVLVLGAGGFIGREVVAGLGATSWAKPILGVRRPRSTGNGERYEERICDAASLDSVSAAVRSVSAVVNCVAGDEHVLIASAKNLSEAARRAPEPPRIVHLSSMAVYGAATGLIEESAPLRADIGPYSVAKIAAEASAASYPRTVILRPGCVFGPRSEQWSVRIARLLLAYRLGDLGPAGDGYCNFVHVSDVVLAVLRALERPTADGRAFNLSAHRSPTWNEFLIQYAKALHAVPVRRISRRRLTLETKVLAPPLKVLEILGRAGRINLRQLPPPIPPSLVRLFGQEIRLDTRRAESELGVQWKSLAESIVETARWYLATERGG